MDRAEEYDRVQYKYQSKDGKELIDKLSLEKFEECKVLDLGCGTGFLTSILAERVGERGMVIGIDPDPARITVARRNYAHLKNILFLVGSSDDIPNGPYDLIFSNHVLHWIEDKRSAIKNIYGSLKEGGKFAFTCCTEADSFSIWGMIKPNVKNSYIQGVDVYTQLVNEYRFNIVFSSAEVMNYVFKNIDSYLEYAMPSMTTSSCSPDRDAVKKVKEKFSNSQEVHFIWTKATFIFTK